MNLAKSFEFFDPALCPKRVHIIGCGSVGSTTAELLARFGITHFTLYDFDHVEPHNMVNQMFVARQVGMEKTEALKQLLLEINPEVDIRIERKGWQGQPIAGYVFLCVDDIEVRKKIVAENLYNNYIETMFDIRTGLTDAQHYACNWKNFEDRKNFQNTMNFSHEDAQRTTPMSACNVALCVAPTVRLIVTAAVSNFINFLSGRGLHKIIMTDAFAMQLDAV